MNIGGSFIYIQYIRIPYVYWVRGGGVRYPSPGAGPWRWAIMLMTISYRKVASPAVCSRATVEIEGGVEECEVFYQYLNQVEETSHIKEFMGFSNEHHELGVIDTITASEVAMMKICLAYHQY